MINIYIFLKSQLPSKSVSLHVFQLLWKISIMIHWIKKKKKWPNPDTWRCVVLAQKQTFKILLHNLKIGEIHNCYFFSSSITKHFQCK